MAEMTLAQTGVGVLDRSVAIIDAVERGERSVYGISKSTGLHRATTHRFIKALEGHGFLAPDGDRGYRLGPRLLRLAATAVRELPLRELAHSAVERLAQVTGESAQLYVRAGDERLCIDAVESNNELRTIVPVGASLPLTAGSAGKVFLAWDPAAERLVRKAPDPETLDRQIRQARSRGWAASAGERQPGVGSVSAPVHGALEELVAVVSISGPVSRIGRISARRYAPAVVAAASEIERALGVA